MKTYKYKIGIIYNRKYLFKFVFNKKYIKIENWLFG